MDYRFTDGPLIVGFWVRIAEPFVRDVLTTSAAFGLAHVGR